MKLLLFLSTTLALLICSCTVEDKQSSKQAQAYKHNKHPGYSVYIKTCYQCHQPADPVMKSNAQWKMTVPRMADHAGISAEEGQQVLEYILARKEQESR